MARSGGKLLTGGIGVMALILIAGLVVVIQTVMQEGAPNPRPGDDWIETVKRGTDLIPLAEKFVESGGVVDGKMQLFRRHMGRYPVSLVELRVKPEQIGEGQRWEGPYVASDEFLLDPWGNPYEYSRDADGAYALWSCGPDGASGTPDDIHN